MTISAARFAALASATAMPPNRSNNDSEPQRIDSYFGCDVFSPQIMRQRLPNIVYKQLMRTIELRQPLDVEVANVVATAMKDWAIENGATHYTHWFQPLTGSTAEKHDAFVVPDGKGGCALRLCPAANCVRASPTPPAFPPAACAPPSRPAATRPGTPPARPSWCAAKTTSTLCIPTAFVSWTGVALDRKRRCCAP